MPDLGRTQFDLEDLRHLVEGEEIEVAQPENLRSVSPILSSTRPAKSPFLAHHALPGRGVVGRQTVEQSRRGRSSRDGPRYVSHARSPGPSR